MKTTAIILSAGKGTRLGGEIPKQYMEVCGRPLLCYTLESFENSRVDDVIIVSAPGDERVVEQDIVQKYGFSKVSMVTAGGAERYDSVLAGLKACTGKPGDKCSYVLIHDGARPFITPEGINAMMDAVMQYDAAVAAQHAKDTIKVTDTDGFVQMTTERSMTWQVQTPQCFRYDLILSAYEKVIGSVKGEGTDAQQGLYRITDDAMVFETAFPDMPVKLIDIGEENIKITTRSDLAYMEWKLTHHNVRGF